MESDLFKQLEDKKKGCAKGKELLKQRLEDKDNKYIADFIKENWKKELVCCQNNLCPSCQAEISALKKGISACEEILNSQQNKCMANDKKPSTKSSSGSHKLNLQQREEESADTQTLIKQALSQRNKEILEIVDKLKIKHTKEHRGCGDPSECCFNRLDVLGWDFFEDLKKQLTTTSEGKE